MSKILIVGAGRVGTAAAKIILHTTSHLVVLADTSTKSLLAAINELENLFPVQGRVQTIHLDEVTTVDSLMKGEKPQVVICATPFNLNVSIAKSAVENGVSYIDFTEDVGVTAEISSMDVGGLTFVPQTGLAPGIVSYLAFDLLKQIGEPHSVDMRVGALPLVSFGPYHYASTWSTEGLINEYIKPAQRLRDGKVEEVPPITDYNTVIVDGKAYEEFTTSGGVGNLAAYEGIPNVEYKTLRYPSHYGFLRAFLKECEDLTFEEKVAKAKRTFQTTRQDVVVLLAHVVDVDGCSASYGLHFYPHDGLGLTALELTTAGTGVAVAELILEGRLPAGIIKPNQIPLDAIMETGACGLIFSQVR